MRDTEGSLALDAEGRHQYIAEAMQRTGGNKKRAAKELGIWRSYLHKRLSMLEAESGDA
jgi:DNA-binding NtrC family response regulator